MGGEPLAMGRHRAPGMVQQGGDQRHAVSVKLILRDVAKFAQALQEQLMGQRHFQGLPKHDPEKLQTFRTRSCDETSD
jgi:hypothetical protein